MPSSYTPLGVQLMNTGEKSGTWGTLTNTNWDIIEQIAGGYLEIDIAGGAQTTDLSVADGTSGDTNQVAHRVIKFTGTITGAQIVTIPLDVQQSYLILNGTSGGYTVQLKYITGSGSSVTWTTTKKDWKVIYASADDATNPDIVEVPLGMTDIVDDTTPQLGGNLDIQSYGLTSSTNIMNSTISGTGKTMILGF